jgi:VanZ family protein
VLPLRYRTTWVALGWLLVAGVVVGSLLPGPLIAPITRPFNDKFMHASAYFVLMLWFGGMYPRARQLPLAVALLLLGVALDLLQALTATRSLDVADMAADLFGILIALALSWWLLTAWCQRVERLLLGS